MLIISKKVKQFLKTKGVRLSEGTLQAIDQEVKKLCLKTADNVLADKLKTARPLHVPKIDPLLEDDADWE